MKSLWGTTFALKARRIKRVPAGMVATNPRTGEVVHGGQFVPEGATLTVAVTGNVIPAGE